MHYPWWHVPYLTAPMLIAVISVVHVLVSHYAVGGGLFLAVEVSYAYRTHDRDYLAYLHRHAWFFVLVTVVFGAITGVGIWWTIGLTSPLATETLIRTFVFGWATEWVFFVVELVSAFIFLYYWGRLPEKTHITMGRIYAAAAWISLVLITGITAFMLNAGNWPFNASDQTFWVAFFNPQFLPQTIARTGGALLLSSLYVYLHASLTIRNTKMRDMIASRSARPAMLGAVLVTAGGALWYGFLPDTAAATLASAAVLNVLMALIFALTAVVFILLYIGPYRNPGWLSPGFAGSLCLFGIAAFSTGEFIREAVRKPFIIDGVVLSNQILPKEVAGLRQDGYMLGGVWTKAYLAENYPRLVIKHRNEWLFRPSELPNLSHEDRVLLGKLIFLHHCNDCHAERIGYSAVGPLLQGRRSRATVLAEVKHLDDTYFMPPWCGTDDDAELLTDYLMMIKPLRPGAERPWTKGAAGGEATEGATP
jgi:cytochrome bd ubiquinol oxidase subunit I